jgi:hypothetical protein
MLCLILLFIFIFNCHCIPIKSNIDIEITIFNNGVKPMIFDYCHTYNQITNVINEILYIKSKQTFNISSIIISSGDCSYIYGSYIINFQWFIDSNQFRYGITNFEEFDTEVYIINKYKAIFIIS